MVNFFFRYETNLAHVCFCYRKRRPSTEDQIGLLMLHNLANVMGAHNVGIYRDDGLAILKDASRPTAERTKKKITKIFQEHGLKITADTNLVETNFLDVTLNLKSGKYWPFRKPNNSPIVCAQSFQPPADS